MQQPVPTVRAKGLRQNQTDAEKAMWHALKAYRLQGHKFRRQFPIGPYIADFACVSLKVIVEIDGGQHNDNPKDLERTAYLSSLNYEVIRFWNHDVLDNMEGVLQSLLNSVQERARTIVS